MFRYTKSALVIPFAALLLITTAAHAQRQPSPTVQDRQREQRSLAVNIVRAINTAEASYKKNQGAYATWATLVGNGDFTNTGTKWAPESVPTVAHAMYGSGPEIVPGWKLRLTVSNNPDAYDLLLEDVNDTKCHYSVGSDDRGLIRQSRVIDCPL